MLCPFRKRTVEYESQIGYGEKGDIIATFKEEHYMECNYKCAYAVLEKPIRIGMEKVIYEEPKINCRRAK